MYMYIHVQYIYLDVTGGGWNSEPSLSQSAATTDKSSVKTEREREVHLGWGLNGGVTFSDTMTQ